MYRLYCEILVKIHISSPIEMGAQSSSHLSALLKTTFGGANDLLKIFLLRFLDITLFFDIFHKFLLY